MFTRRFGFAFLISIREFLRSSAADFLYVAVQAVTRNICQRENETV